MLRAFAIENLLKALAAATAPVASGGTLHARYRIHKLTTLARLAQYTYSTAPDERDQEMDLLDLLTWYGRFGRYHVPLSHAESLNNTVFPHDEGAFGRLLDRLNTQLDGAKVLRRRQRAVDREEVERLAIDTVERFRPKTPPQQE
jgi:hypothetical protein